MAKEKYRKYKQCPVPNCKAKAQKRLANHIARYHKDVSPRKRLQYCRKALKVSKKYVPKPWDKKGYVFLKRVNEKLLISVLLLVVNHRHRNQLKKCTTRSMCSYLESHRKMNYLQTMDGGNQRVDVSLLISRDVSKYLFYADSDGVRYLTNVKSCLTLNT